ncbi:MAG: hypothetical protein AB7M12_09620 [Hyphomonadaceae bacterium]
MAQLIFVDFEASSLTQESWPIEAGYAADTGEEDAFLLRRQPGWSLEHWDRWAAVLHGISLADLDAEGISPQAALRRLAPLKTAMVVSDAPEYDGYWLGRIAEAAGEPAPFVVSDWDRVLPSDLSRETRDALLADARAEAGRHHRAGPDSKIMRAVWRAAWASRI